MLFATAGTNSMILSLFETGNGNNGPEPGYATRMLPNDRMERFVKKQKIDNLSLLRKKAEAKLKKQEKTQENLSGQSVRELAHELGTHQIELEMQNEELRRARDELEASRSKYVDLYDFAPVGYFTLDKNGLIVEVNLTGAEMLGMNRRLLLKKPIGSFLAGQADRDIFHLHRREVLQTQGRQTCEVMIRKKDAPAFVAQIISMPMEAGAGHSRMSLIDISQRRLAEGLRSAHAEIERDTARIVSRSEKKYRELFENMISGFAFHKIIVDKKGRPVDYEFQEVNHAFEKLTGLKSADILGKRVTEVLPGIEHDPANWIGMYGEVALTGKEVRFEQYAKPLGKWFFVSAYCPMPGYFAAIFEDITERKKSEKEIEHLASFPRLNPSPVIEMDPKGNITFLNAAAKNILASLGIPDGAAMFLPDNARDIWQATSDGGDARTLYREVEIKDRVFAENVYVSKELGVIRIYAIDITERKRAEKEREHLLVQVQRQAMELDTIFKALPYLVSVHAIDGRYLRVNPAIVKLFGFDPTNATREEIARKVKAQFPDGRPLTPENMPSSRALKGEAVHGVEYQLTNEQGETHDLLMNAIPLQTAGRVYGIVIAQMDITVRKRAANVVQARLRLAEASSTGAKSVDEVLRLTLDEIETLTGGKIGFYHFLEEDQETISLQSWSTNTVSSMCTADGAGSHYSISKAGVWVDCVREKKPVIHNDYASLPHKKGMPHGHATVIREMVVPLFRGGRIVAIIGVGNKETDFTDADVEIARLLGDFSWEIVKRKRSEEALRKSEQLLHYHIGNSPLAVIEWGPDMRLTRWSGAAERVFGWNAEEVLDKRMDDFRWIYKDDEPHVEEVSADLQTGANPRRFSANRNYRKDGSVIYCEWYNSSLVDASGNLRSILSLALDVTARKRAEEALLQSEATLRGILDATNESVWLFSSDGMAILANRTGVHRLGKKIEDVMGKHLGDIVPPDVALTRMERLRQVVASGQPVDFEDTRDGIMFHHSLYPVFGRDGRVVRVASFSRDITERKRIDQALAKKTGELEDLNKNLEMRVEEELLARRKNEHLLIQQSKLAAMGEMLSAIAHQWRQPLNVVGLIVQNMQEAFEQGKLDPDHMDRSVRKTMAQIEHMSRTIEDFRSFIIPDKEKRTFDAMRAVGNVLSLLSPQLSGDRITCRLTCHSHGETIYDQKDISECAEKAVEGYQNEFEHVVFNLINNACDAILEKRRSENGDKSEPGLLSFDFYNRDGRVIVEISDNGSGIPAAVMDRIFEPYFSTKDTAKGTGIGLYMSKVIVEDHLNGTLTAKKHEGGAMFTISLPQAWTKGSS